MALFNEHNIKFCLHRNVVFFWTTCWCVRKLEHKRRGRWETMKANVCLSSIYRQPPWSPISTFRLLSDSLLGEQSLSWGLVSLNPLMPKHLFWRLSKQVIGHLTSFTGNILVSNPKTDTSTLLRFIEMKKMWQRPLELQEYLEKMFLSVRVKIIYYPAFMLISCFNSH